ncbi:unnamed protein product, partial [Timema podura]|nr:unnamed protein product [Timema podura]
KLENDKPTKLSISISGLSDELGSKLGIRVLAEPYYKPLVWVPGSDVVVAQSRNNLCVWYNIDSPDQVTLFPIKGDAVDVVRADGKTEVVVEEGQHQLGYELDEGLLEFGTAIHDNDLGQAILFLEKLGDKPEAEGMWSNLANIAIATNKLRVAERCYAALGD